MDLARRSSVVNRRTSVSWASGTRPEIWQPADNSALSDKWGSVLARDIIDLPLVTVDEEISVEQACEALLANKTSCLAIRSAKAVGTTVPYIGLFDFADVNAFLTLAATRSTALPEHLRNNTQVTDITSAARTGLVPVKLVSNLSEKNPLRILANDSSLLSLLEVFSQGTHRVLIEAEDGSSEYLGFVSDRGLLSWLCSFAQESSILQQYFANSLEHLALPSLNLFNSVIACGTQSTVLDAMKLMSEEGVGSVAVVNEETGALLSAISVTDIAKMVVPSPDGNILTMTVGQFVSLVKEPDGVTDGEDKFPVYSVNPVSPLGYTIQKLLATNAHRLFVSSTASMTGDLGSGCLSGIVSVVDVLSQFASLVDISNIDPQKMHRHRSMSTSSSGSHRSANSLSRRSSRQSPVRSLVSSAKQVAQ